MSKQDSVANSVVSAVVGEHPKRRGILQLILHFFSVLLSLYRIQLTRTCPDRFRRLREEYWNFAPGEYQASFETRKALKPVGDMGFSGSVSGRVGRVADAA